MIVSRINAYYEGYIHGRERERFKLVNKWRGPAGKPGITQFGSGGDGGIFYIIPSRLQVGSIRLGVIL